jgi:biotin carboxyl carrier protein
VKYEIVIDGNAATLSADGECFTYQREGGAAIEGSYSMAPAGDGIWSILIDGRSYGVALGHASEVSVNGRVFHVEAFDPRGLRGRRATQESSGPQAVAALMPGQVIRVLVEAGQEVEAGQGLIVVEAMKMQNEMNPPRAGRVAAVKAAAGATVSAGDVLVVIE